MILRGQALAVVLKKAWAVYSYPWVIVAVYWITLWCYFGFHWAPQSDKEMDSFGFGFLMFLLAAKR